MLKQFIKRHWLGQYPLLLTLLLTVLVLRLTLGQVQSVIPAIAMLPWMVFTLVIMVWQVVGTFRAGDRYLQETGSIILYWCLYFFLIVNVVLTGLQLADFLSQNSVRQQASAVTSQVHNDKLPLSRGGTAVTVSGDFSWDLRAAFLRTINANTSVNTVILSSDGGLVFTGRALALTISERGFSTHVESHCYSACTLAFMAGRHRTMHADAKLGFHRYRLDNANQTHGVSVEEELLVDRAHFSKNGISEEFLNQLFIANHNDIWIPDRQTLINAGVLTQ